MTGFFSRNGRMMLIVRRLAADFVAALISFFARLVTAVRGVRHGDEAFTKPCVFYANHASHCDFILIWTVLPPGMRSETRPVAGADYWQASRLRRFIGIDVFKSLLIPRNGERTDPDPIDAMALDQGDCLIFFPEGTRNTGKERLLPLKIGIFRLAEARPDSKRP
ncbi:UNVERIFIED_ORG: acyltransferase-like protein [Martelella mediterranea]